MQSKEQNTAKKSYLVINAGSSSFKFTLFINDNNDLLRAFYGEVEGIGGSPHFYAYNQECEKIDERDWAPSVSRAYLLGYLIDWISARIAPNILVAIGHRMVHGGVNYKKPVIATPEILDDLRELVYLSPLHQPRVLNAIDELTERHPDLPHVICFDTAFHQTNPRVSQLYGLPSWLSDIGVIRYGFHGLSFEYISKILPGIDKKAAKGNTIIAHLGSGASMCALKNGKSVASTMGFTALDGLVMGTRCGTIDPGVLLYLLQQRKMEPTRLQKLLYEYSGLLGISGGISSDLRALLASDEPRAKEAIEVFVYRIARETGSLASAAGGLDAFVFTAGIGEKSALIREKICAQLQWLGIKLDKKANNENRQKISASDSKVNVWALQTNEEFMIARHMTELMGMNAKNSTI